ncbi:GNAT family N-acetyltransferase [Massilia forsythiae]|uniref:GNAT family N-acetyltransferase n=1 Tax=Massilia forsythiae TaxID=2728020 RepID=A0A7Z2VUF6_9BURK|nr:GNAT family N-acetyltransferase [Massilia forsythiae]QJD99134.1 GNAT family N-acetyltransferase [Massilia forsythiae]
MRTDFKIRAATVADTPALQTLIERSGIGLSAGFYTSEQAHAITREVFGVDTQLIRDGTYFAIEDDTRIVACGGWSKRSTPYGGDQHKAAPDRLLDPATEAAKIRAFFVDPGMARLGLGSMLMRHCSAQALAAGFAALELTATMPGVPLYTAHGFVPVHDLSLALGGGQVAVNLTLMRKALQ